MSGESQFGQDGGEGGSGGERSRRLPQMLGVGGVVAGGGSICWVGGRGGQLRGPRTGDLGIGVVDGRQAVPGGIGAPWCITSLRHTSRIKLLV